jgi:CPA2 family monovalent cation:H+ antiporter-2
MSELVYMQDLVIILAFAVVIVIVFHKLKLPPIAGFILCGAVVGPQGLALISDSHQVEVLSEIGVALLLFGIGVQLSLMKLQRLWKLAVVGGTLQVGLTAALAFAIARIFGLSSNQAIFIGLLVALSSTAIVLRGLQQRGEVDAPHGRLILGILVFQDFAVIPIMLVIPLLTGLDLSVDVFLLTLAKSAGIVVAVLLLAILVVPRVLSLVAKTRQRQLFVLSVFLICLGTAWLVTKSGASLAVGAFLAGLVVSGSQYRHQALADMISFREVFAALFFVSIGMLLSPVMIYDNLIVIIGLLAAILIGKSLIVFVAALMMRMPVRVCLIAAIALAQIGEFSFILLFSVKGTGLITGALENNLVTAAILSMFLTPFAMSFGPRLATGLGKFSRLKRFLQVNSAEEASEAVGGLHDHIIVCGYGFAGRELSLVLQEHDLPFVIVDINIENVERAARETGKAVYGDVTSRGVLSKLGIDSARELMVLINDPSASEQAVRVARELAPQLFITVRTFYLLDIQPLLAAGADEVIPAEREAAIQVATQLLKRHEIEDEKISRQELVIREHSEDES